MKRQRFGVLMRGLLWNLCKMILAYEKDIVINYVFFVVIHACYEYQTRRCPSIGQAISVLTSTAGNSDPGMR